MTNEFYQHFDFQRLQTEATEDDYRSVFQVDRDRIIHTPSFRKLQSKTQVFWSGEYDFYRTRLTHSLEVAQIGRSICHWLQKSSELLTDSFFIDPDLVEASCLSHDLGHPPFGHAGEKTLNDLMREHGGFEGNAQTLRLISQTIFSQSNRGMNPSRAFLDSILKYRTLWSELRNTSGAAPEHHYLYDFQTPFLDFVMDGNDFPPEFIPGEVRDGFKPIECQVMDWADDTAYSLNDLSDSARAGFLRVEKVEEWAKTQGLSIEGGTPLGDLLSAIRRERVEPFVGRKIGNYIKATRLVQDENMMSSHTNRYRYRLEVDPEMREECRIYKKLAYEVVFLSPELSQLEHQGAHVLSQLWSVLSARYIKQEPIYGHHFNLLPAREASQLLEAQTTTERARMICDFIASLSDGHANRLYQRLFVPGYGSIGDVV